MRRLGGDASLAADVDDEAFLSTLLRLRLAGGVRDAVDVERRR